MTHHGCMEVWNVTQRICWAVIFICLQHFILPYLNYFPACKPKAEGQEIAIRAVIEVGQNKMLQTRTYLSSGPNSQDFFADTGKYLSYLYFYEKKVFIWLLDFSKMFL